MAQTSIIREDPRDLHASSAPDRHFLALGTLTEILAGTDDADALFTRALEVVRGAVDLPASAVLLLDPAGEMRLRVGTAMPGELLEMALARWPSSCADPDPAVLDESGPDEAFGSLLRAAGLRSLLLFPLRCGGRTLGCCVFGSGSDRPLTPGGMQFVRSAANLLGCAAQRTGQAAGPTRSAAFTEHLLETAHLIIVGLDAHGRVVIFNEAAELAMNLRKGDVLGQDWFKMAIPQERRTARRASFARFLETGAPREVEATLLVRGGQERLIAWRNTRFHEPGTDLAVLCFGIDVTEARRSTEALKASEERFSRVFHMSPDAIDLTRLEDGVCLDCNQSYLNLYGYAREEVIGHSTLPGDLGIWERGEDRARHVAELLDTGHAFDFETTLRRRDGRTLVGLIASSVIEVDGQPCNLSLTRDITERKRTEEVLRESARRLELALASNHLGIWDRDLRDDTEIWDDRMYGIYGLEPGALRPDFTTWIERIVLPEDAAQLASDVGEALAGKRPYDLQFRIVRPDGAVRHVASHGMVVRDAAGKAVRVIGINQDRTEQEDAERERRRLQIEAHHAEKLESLGSLAGGVAHDMNNVLTAILVMAEILRDRFQLDGAAIRSIETILHAGQRGRDLVKALTDFARKDLDAIVPIDLNELLRKEVDLLRHTTLGKVQVVLDLDEALPGIQGAASDLGSAIMNLSVNALDAMPAGGTLIFRTRGVRGGWVEVAVSDSGQGMTPEVLAKALEPFFTTKPKGRGTGLGLSRVYGTVKAHGGSVEIQSAPGRGTTVLIRLPSRAATVRRSEAPDTGPEATEALRILLVDDEPILLDTLCDALQAAGHAVEPVASGEAALARLAAPLRFDLVLLDHNMPGLSGLQTLIQIRQRHPGLPVILSSGFLDPETEASLEGMPQAWVLKKPYSTQELQATFARIARSRVQA